MFHSNYHSQWQPLNVFANCRIQDHSNCFLYLSVWKPLQHKTKETHWMWQALYDIWQLKLNCTQAVVLAMGWTLSLLFRLRVWPCWPLTWAMWWGGRQALIAAATARAAKGGASCSSYQKKHDLTWRNCNAIDKLLNLYADMWTWSWSPWAWQLFCIQNFLHLMIHYQRLTVSLSVWKPLQHKTKETHWMWQAPYDIWKLKLNCMQAVVLPMGWTLSLLFSPCCCQG